MEFEQKKHILLLLRLLALVCLKYAESGIVESSQYLSECRRPFGMSSSDTARYIICQITLPSDTSQCANDCSDVRFNSNSFWCGTTAAKFSVTLPDTAIFTGVSLRAACSGCKINKFKVQYKSPHNGNVWNTFPDHNNPTIFEVSSESIVWLPEALTVSAIRVISEENDADGFKVQIELYGCPYWDYFSPIGLESGVIGDQQLISDCNSNNCLNTQSVRFNTAQFSGWYFPESVPPGVTESTYLKIVLDELYTISSLVIKCTATGANGDGSTAHVPSVSFLLRYSHANHRGTSIAHLGGINAGTSNTPVVFKVFMSAEESGRYKNSGRFHMKYAIYTQDLYFYPVDADPTYMSVEVYGQKGFAPSHHWMSYDNILMDVIGYHHFPASQKTEETTDGSIKLQRSSKEELFQSLPFRSDDCIVNPSNCHEGFTLSMDFYMKSNLGGEHVTFTSSLTSTSGSEWVKESGHWRKKRTTSCINNEFDMNFVTALHFDSVTIHRGEMIFTAGLHQSYSNIPMDQNRYDVYIKLRAFVGKGSNFVSDCQYGDFGHDIAQSDNFFIVNKNKASISDLREFFQTIVNHADWRYGNSLTLYMENTDGYIYYQMPHSYILTINHRIVCEKNDVDEKYLLTLEDASFTQSNTPCADGSGAPHRAKLVSGWKDCAGSGNELVIDLQKLVTISMITARGKIHQYGKEFHVYYGVDQPNTLATFGTRDYFVKKFWDWEYLPFSNPITARYLKIVPKSHYGDLFLLQMDVILCKTVNAPLGEQEDFPECCSSTAVDFAVKDDSVLPLEPPNIQVGYEYPTDKTFGLRSNKQLHGRNGKYCDHTLLYVDMHKYVLCSREGRDIYSIKASMNGDNSLFTNSREMKKIAAFSGADFVYAILADDKLYKHRILYESRVDSDEWVLVSDNSFKDIYASDPSGILYCLSSDDKVFEYNVYAGQLDLALVLADPAKLLKADTKYLYVMFADGDLKKYARHAVTRNLVSPLVSSGIDKYSSTQGTGYVVYSSYLAHNRYDILGIFRTSTKNYDFSFGAVNLNTVTRLAFTWKKTANKLYAFRDGAETDVVDPMPISGGPYKQLPWGMVINIGAYNYKTVTTTHGLTIYDLKVWRRFVLHENIYKLMTDKPAHMQMKLDSNTFVDRATCANYGKQTSPCHDAEVQSRVSTDTKSFYLGNIAVNYFTGKSLCKQSGGRLAQIHTEQHMDELTIKLNANSGTGNVFIGIYNSDGAIDAADLEYSNFLTASNDDAHSCVSVSQLTSEWVYTDCNEELIFICEADTTLSQDVYQPINYLSFKADDTCQDEAITTTTSQHSLFNLASPTNKFSVVHFENIELHKHMKLHSAHLVVTTAELADQTLYVSFLNSNDDCSQIGAITNLKTASQPWPNYPWELKASEKKTRLVSPDLSQRLKFQFGLTYPNKTTIGELPVVIYWDEATSQVDDFKVENVHLVVNYVYQAENIYMLLNTDQAPSLHYNPLSEYQTPFMPYSSQQIEFWYHMYSGTMFVHVLSSSTAYPAFVDRGNRNSLWRKGTLKHFSNRIKLNFIFFAEKDDILALDGITPTYVTGDGTQSALADNFLDYGTDWKDQLIKMSLPTPILIHPFHSARNHVIDNGGGLRAVGSHLHRSNKPNKYAIPYGATEVTFSKHAYMETGDITGFYPANGETFTIMFDLMLHDSNNRMTLFQLERFVVSFDDNTMFLLMSDGTSFLDVQLEPNKWYYIGLVYKDKKIKAYVDLEEVGESIEFDSVMSSATYLHFFAALAGREFLGKISCFQMFQESLSVQQMQQLEFCPVHFNSCVKNDLLETHRKPPTEYTNNSLNISLTNAASSYIHECKNGGYLIPPHEGCICPDEVASFRFYDQLTCENVFVWEWQIFYMTFDFETISDGRNSLAEIDDGGSRLEASFMNNARCKNSEAVLLSDIYTDCMMDFTDCSSGFVISLWLHINPESATPANGAIFVFGHFEIIADFSLIHEYFIPAQIKWQTHSMLCVHDFHLPMQVWAYLNVIVSPSAAPKIQLNDQWAFEGNTGTCSFTPQATVNTAGELKFGSAGVNVCVDELSVRPYANLPSEDMIYQAEYHLITKGPWFHGWKLSNNVTMTSSTATATQCQSYCLSQGEEYVSVAATKALDIKYNGPCLCSHDLSLELEKDPTWKSTFPKLYDLLYRLPKNSYNPSFNITVESDIVWQDDAIDRNSMFYVYLSGVFVKVVEDYVNDDMVVASLESASASDASTVVGSMTVEFPEGLTKPYAELFRTSVEIEFEGRNFKLTRIGGTEIGLPRNIAPVVAITNHNITSFVVEVTDAECIHQDATYQKGFSVHAKLYYGETANNDNFLEEIELDIYTGSTKFYLNVLLGFRVYELTFWCTAHEGYSPMFEMTHSTPASVNFISPNVTEISNTSTTTIQITWQAYEKKLWCADFVKYRIFYHEVTPDVLINLDTDDPTDGYAQADTTDLEYTLEQLKPFTNYSVFVSTVNVEGVGELSHHFLRTAEDVPDVGPTIVSITRATGSDVMVTWNTYDDIEMINTWELLGFVVNVTAMYPEYTIGCESQSFQLQGGNTSLLIPMCEAFQPFNISIAAFNWVGIGVYSEYCFVSPTSVVGIPETLVFEDISQEANNFSTVNVTMGGMAYVNENNVIMTYKLYHESLNWTDTVKSAIIPTTKTDDEITYYEAAADIFLNCSLTMAPRPTAEIMSVQMDLHYYTNYNFSVQACDNNSLCGNLLTKTFLTAMHVPTCVPPNLNIHQVDSRSLRVTFDVLDGLCLHGPLSYYGVLLLEEEHYERLVAENASLDQIISNSTFGQADNTGEYVFSGLLEEYWNYTALVYAVNEVGIGAVSEPMWELTTEDAPSGIPICNETVGPFSINVSINYPSIRDRNGIITEYDVSLSQLNDPAFSIQDTIQAIDSGNIYTFAGLIANTIYNIEVLSRTAEGDGPAWQIEIQTIELPPSAAPNGNVKATTNDSITIHWKKIPMQVAHGILKYYILNGCGRLANGSNHCFDANITAAEDEHEHHFGGLFPATNYTFNITGCTTPGCGPNLVLDQLTLEMIPSGVVSLIHVVNKTANAFHLNWTDVPAMQRRGVITKYEINITRLLRDWEDAEQYSKSAMLETQRLYLDVGGLDNYTEYQFFIVAYTNEGAGPTSEQVVYETLQNVPSSAPFDFNATDSSSSSLNVSWLPLHVKYHEGVLLGYNISYEFVNSSTFEHRNGSLAGHWICYGAESSFCDVQELELHTNYSLSVAALTHVGLGPWTEEIVQATDYFVDGNWTVWTQWGSCDRSCGLGKEMRQRWCTNPRPMFGGKLCDGEHMEFKECNDYPCIGYYLSDFDQSCSSLCEGLGEDFLCAPVYLMKNRAEPFYGAIDFSDYRKSANLSCTTEEDSDYFAQDTDPSLDTNIGLCRGYKELNRTNCEATSNTVRRLCKCLDKESAMFTEWAIWGACSKDCGTGRYQRYRECLYASCDGKELDTADCNIHPCPIDGNWGQWSNFTSCSASCGFGRQRRRRECDDPMPEYDGLDCVGIDVEHIDGCNPLPCPRIASNNEVHGGWGEWSTYGECKQPCGDKRYQQRRRMCDNPVPMYDGDDCVGNKTVNIDCVDSQCQTVDVDYVVRFIDEVWNYTMYNLKSSKAVALRGRIIENLRYTYKNSSLPNVADNFTVTIWKLKRGSVIVNFTISYPEIPMMDLLILQDAIDNVGYIGTLPVELRNVTSNDIPPLPPSNISLESTISTINVSWAALENLTSSSINGQFNLYYVFFREIDTSATWDNIGTINTTVLIPDLKPATLYAVRLLVSTVDGNGIPSEHYEIRTQEGAPYKKPGNCEMQITGDTTVYFDWEHVLPADVPGILNGYRILYRNYYQTGEAAPVIDITEPAMSQRTITRFKSFTWYHVEIAAFTGGGLGPACVFVFRTPPGAPGAPPPNATVDDYYATEEMIVSWDALLKEDENGDLTGYKLFYFITRVAGVDLGQQEITFVTLDRYTFSYRIQGLQSYTEYEIHLYAYSRYGDGPVVVLSGGTCKCPANIYTNYHDYKPFITAELNGDVEKYSGLFPELLSGIINIVCTGCKSYQNPPLFFNKTKNGRPAKKVNFDAVVNGIDSGTHFTFPVFGQFHLTTFSGIFPFIGIIQSQGSAMIVYQPKIVAVGFVKILSAVAHAWPIVLVSIMLAYVTGCVVWFAEQGSEESEINTNRFFYGSAEGFWMAFITMTTVGYGDFVPTTNSSKLVMIFWVLAGLVVISIFGGVVSSGMSVGNFEAETRIYGTKVAAVKDSFEYRKAILLSGIVDQNKTYANLHEIMEAVASRTVEIGLIDSSAALGYEAEMEAMNLRISKVLKYNTGFGVVLSGDAERLKTDIESFVSSNQGKITSFVEQKIGVLKPTIVEYQELLLTPEESSSIIMTLLYILAALLVVGFIVEKIYKCHKKQKVLPQDAPQAMYNDIEDITKYGNEFFRSFPEQLEEMSQKHDKQRVQLNIMKMNYARQMKRLGLHEMYQKAEKHNRRKFERKQIHKRLENSLTLDEL